MTICDAGEGAILGSLCGDAAGATVEFEEGPVPDERVKEALHMTGGGPWGTAPGQITDDGEMALSLMHALAAREAFSVEAVAERYYRWYTSRPFDIGRTTTNGISGADGRPEGALHEGMWEAAAERNGTSLANGALMRITPLGVWGRRLDPADLVTAACNDARLTHAHTTCQHASAVYCVAIRHLVQRTAYEEAIRETLAGGGDTDTNACIVGGLIGALGGANGIPPRMRDAVLTCDVSTGRGRPDFLQTREVLARLIAAIS